MRKSYIFGVLISSMMQILSWNPYLSKLLADIHLTYKLCTNHDEPPYSERLLRIMFISDLKYNAYICTNAEDAGKMVGSYR